MVGDMENLCACVEETADSGCMYVCMYVAREYEVLHPLISITQFTLILECMLSSKAVVYCRFQEETVGERGPG
jgi:hypothetical protein